MKCPFCGHTEDRVVDSRVGREGEFIRRRRECLKCHRRYTTYEYIEDVLPHVGRHEWPLEHHRRIAGQQAQDRKCERGRDEHRDERLDHAPQNVPGSRHRRTLPTRPMV